MNFLAIQPADILTDIPGTEVRQQGIVAQFSYFQVGNLYLDRTRTDTPAL